MVRCILHLLFLNCTFLWLLMLTTERSSLAESIEFLYICRKVQFFDEFTTLLSSLACVAAKQDGWTVKSRSRNLKEWKLFKSNLKLRVYNEHFHMNLM